MSGDTVASEDLRPCPVPTPAERQYGAIQERITAGLVRDVHAAIRAAAAAAAAEMAAAGLTLPPPAPAFLTAVVHQTLFCTPCKADPDTFAGGDPATARAIIRNAENIARHHWGAVSASSSERA